MTLAVSKNVGASQVEYPKMGHKLCERAKQVRNIAGAIADAVTQAQKAGFARTGCSVAALASGMAEAYTGITSASPITFAKGAGLAVMGGISLLQIFKNSGAEKLVELLHDADASAGMLEDLVAADQASYELIETNLTGVKAGFEDLNERMNSINTLAQKAHKKVKKLEAEANKHHKLSLRLYEEADASFQKSKEKIDSGNAILQEAAAGFQEIAQLAKSNTGSEEERCKRFIDISENLHVQCLKGMVALELGNRLIVEGQKKMQLAHKEHVEAANLVGRITEKAKILEEIASKAKPNEEALELLGGIQKETRILQERNKDKVGIIETIKETIEQALDAIPSYLTMSNLGAVAAVSAFAPSAPLVVPTALAAKTVVHNRLSIGNKIHDFFHGKVRDKATSDFAPLETEGKVGYAFDLRSTGWRKWFPGANGSKTEGDIQIDLGAEKPFTCRFHKGKKKLIRDKDLKALQQEMAQGLQAGRLTKSDCLEILKALALPQKSFGNHALVTEKGAHFFGEIKRFCQA